MRFIPGQAPVIACKRYWRCSIIDDQQDIANTLRVLTYA
jgi:hypothetical protein